MNLKQKSFLDEFSALLMKYNMDGVQADGENVIFYSNYHALKIKRFVISSGRPKFLEVSADYRPEEAEELEKNE